MHVNRNVQYKCVPSAKYSKQSTLYTNAIFYFENLTIMHVLMCPFESFASCEQSMKYISIGTSNIYYMQYVVYGNMILLKIGQVP